MSLVSLVHRRPRWKFTRQQTPLTAGPKQIENRVYYSPYINASGTTPRFPFRDYRIYQRPLRLGQIRCVYPHSCLQNLERSLRTRLVTAGTFQTASKRVTTQENEVCRASTCR